MLHQLVDEMMTLWTKKLEDKTLPVTLFTHWWQMVEVFILPRILAQNAKGKTVLQELTHEGEAVQDLTVRPKHLSENTSLLKLKKEAFALHFKGHPEYVKAIYKGLYTMVSL